MLVGAGEAAYDTVAPLPPKWWRLYEDPVLDELIEKALVHNTDIRQAVASLEKMRAMLRDTEAEETPQTSLSGTSSLAGAKANPGGMKVTGSPALNYDLMGSITCALDLAGKLKRSAKESRANVGEEQALLDLMRVNTAASTASAYASACIAGLSIVVTKRSIEVARKMLYLMERRAGAGVAAANDVLQSRGTLRQTAAIVKSLPKLSPISRPNVTPLDHAEAALNRVLSVRWDDGAVGKWPAEATAQSLAEAGHLSIAGAGRDRCGSAVSCGS